MADSYFKPPDPERRVLRNNANITGLSTINRNSEFKVPRIPSRYATQTLCSNAPPPQNLEPSALQLMKTIGDKLEVIDKLRIIPLDEVKQLSAEYVQKLDSLCMEKIARHFQSNSNPIANVMNDNGSAFHTLLSNAPTIQPSVRSCNCQASTCGSEMGYPARKEIVPKNVPAPLKPIPESSSKQVKSLRVLPSDDENESVVSFFKKNQSRSRSTKSTIKKPVTSTTNGTLKGKKETSVIRKPRAVVHRRSLSADSRVNERKTKRAAISRRSKDDSDSTIMGPPAVRKKRNSASKENTEAPKRPKKRTTNKDNPNLPTPPKKRKTIKNSSKTDDNVNITRDSLRESRGTQRVTNPIAEASVVIPKLTLLANENARNVCGYDQTDREFFGDVSAIVGESFQDSPNNVMKNMTKMSSNRNDLPLHFFSPFANTRSVSGFSAISTPLSKTVIKPNFNNRLKKPDTLAELKVAKSRPVTKRIVKNDIVRLDASEDTVNSEFSDYDNDNSDES